MEDMDDMEGASCRVTELPCCRVLSPGLRPARRTKMWIARFEKATTIYCVGKERHFGQSGLKGYIKRGAVNVANETVIKLTQNH